MPPAWPRALAELGAPGTYRVSEVVHLRQKFGERTADEKWLTVLADEGEWAVLSKDGFKKSDAEKALIRRAGLAVFVLAPAWNKSPHWQATVQMIRWWPKIVETSHLTRTALRVPWNVTSKLEGIRL